MRNDLRSVLVVVLLAILSAPASADTRELLGYSNDSVVLAQDDGPGRRGRHNREREGDQGRVVPLEVVINALMSQYPGKPLDARGPIQRGNQLIYEIVWLTQNGRQIVVIVDARTGQVLRVRGLG